MTLQQPVFQENDTTDQHAIQVRQFMRGMYNNRPGVTRGGDYKVSQRGAGANLSVDVAAGHALVLGSAVTHQGLYSVYNDAVVNVTGFTPDGANPRYVSVLLKVRDAFYSGGNNDAVFELVHGTPAGSPTPPDLVALGHTNYLNLANVLLSAGDTSVTDGEITNLPQTVSAWGSMMVVTSATRPTMLVADEGLMIYELDTNRIYEWNGLAWVPQVFDRHKTIVDHTPAEQLGTNDVTSGTFVAVMSQDTLTVPSGVTTLHYDLTMMGVIIAPGSGTEVANFETRLVYDGAAVAGTTYSCGPLSSVFGQSFSTFSRHFRGQVASGSAGSRVLQIEARRLSGTAALRQNGGWANLQYWFD